MRIVVEDLPEGPSRRHGTVTIALQADHDADQVVVSGPVSYDLTLTRGGAAVRIEGSLAALAEVACCRCARRFEIGVEREFTEMFAAAGEREGVLPRELDADDLDLDYYEGDAIDGLQLLAEQIFLGLPMKILCTEDCKGLCVVCGADRNQTDCDCEVGGDPRWAALQSLRDRL